MLPAVVLIRPSSPSVATAVAVAFRHTPTASLAAVGAVVGKSEAALTPIVPEAGLASAIAPSLVYSFLNSSRP